MCWPTHQTSISSQRKNGCQNVDNQENTQENIKNIAFKTENPVSTQKIMDKPLIAVVIPAYNAERSLKKTYDDIVPSQNKQEIDTDVFIPEF